MHDIPCRKAPNYIKIDVDGNELHVLRGITLQDDIKHLISLQVETHPRRRKAVDECISDRFGFKLDHRHYTQNGQQQIDKGADPESVICNSVYVRAA